jgi:hypothetical protein
MSSEADEYRVGVSALLAAIHVIELLLEVLWEGFPVDHLE